MPTQTDTCRIWGNKYRATGYILEDPSKVVIEHSARAGGGYVFPGPMKLLVEQLDRQERARLTTWLIDQRMKGVARPQITEGAVIYAKSKRPLPVYERAERLLRFIADSLDTVGDYVTASPESCDAACAWSESIEWQEVHFLLDYLKDKGWVQAGTFATNMFKGWATVDGYSRIAEQQANVDTSQAFVAMWFDDSMKEAFENGIEPAIKEAGYNPLRIDRKDHINKIDDEIIAELRRSRFVVADFTHGNDGARGGVYYEAGFAHGLSLPVIFTCRKDSMSSLHFDTNHYNHIEWTESVDLRENLEKRILAIIGEGPESQSR